MRLITATVKNKNMIKILLLLTISFIISCSSKIDNINPEIKMNNKFICSLIEVDSIMFELDSLTSPFISASHYEDSTKRYSFLSNNKTICVYSYTSNSLVKKVDLSLTGGAALYAICNDGRIITYNDRTLKVDVLNNNNTITNSFDVKPDIEYFPNPYVGTSPIIVVDNNIILTGSIAGEDNRHNKDNRKTCFLLNLNSGNVKSFAPYPDLYYEYTWGGLNYWLPYSTKTSERQKVLISHPISHDVFLIDVKSEVVESYYAGSKFVDKIPSYNTSFSFINLDRNVNKYFAENHSYANVLYDMYENVYYRVAEIKTKIDGQDKWNKKISIIILNSEFQIIGETYIGSVGKSNRYTMFVNEKGLHLQTECVSDDLCFKIFKLTYETSHEQ